jgi:hypothetical protein
MEKNTVNAVVGKEATLVVSRTMFHQETEERSQLPIRPFATIPAKVAVKLGRTINLGNYESARVDVSMEMPCYREEVSEVYPKLFSHVAGLLAAEVGKITGTGQTLDVTPEELI